MLIIGSDLPHAKMQILTEKVIFTVIFYFTKTRGNESQMN